MPETQEWEYLFGDEDNSFSLVNVQVFARLYYFKHRSKYILLPSTSSPFLRWNQVEKVSIFQDDDDDYYMSRSFHEQPLE